MRITRRRSQLQCCLPQQCSGVVHVGQGNCFFFFPVKKEEKEEEEQVEEEQVEEENKENGKEITTTMQSSAAMQRSCTGGQGNCLFPANN